METQMQTQFTVTVAGVDYPVVRVLESEQDQIQTYAFTTEVNGQPHTMRARYSTALSDSVREQHGLEMIDELQAIVNQEIQLEIEKIIGQH